MSGSQPIPSDSLQALLQQSKFAPQMPLNFSQNHVPQQSQDLQALIALQKLKKMDMVNNSKIFDKFNTKQELEKNPDYRMAIDKNKQALERHKMIHDTEQEFMHMKKAHEAQAFENMIRRIKSDPQFRKRVESKSVKGPKIPARGVPIPNYPNTTINRYHEIWNSLGTETQRELLEEKNQEAKARTMQELIMKKKQMYNDFRKELNESIFRHMTNKLARQILRQRANRIVIDVKDPLSKTKPYFYVRDPNNPSQTTIQYLLPAKHFNDDIEAPYIDETTNLVFRLRRTWTDFWREKIFGQIPYYVDNIKHYVSVKKLNELGGNIRNLLKNSNSLGERLAGTQTGPLLAAILPGISEPRAETGTGTRTGTGTGIRIGTGTETGTGTGTGTGTETIQRPREQTNRNRQNTRATHSI